MFLTIHGFTFEVPEDITPALDQRVDSGWAIAHLKDTGGSCSYDAWRANGLMDGYNGTVEFLTAVAKPTNQTKKEFPRKTDREVITECYEHAQPGEAQAFWDWYSEKKGWKKLLAEQSESNTIDSPATENPSV
jgi:hypothetical protein